MGKYTGADFCFIADSSVVAYAKTFEYSLSDNLAKGTTLADGKWDTFVKAGGKALTGSLDSFMMADADSSRGFNYFLNAWFNDASIAVQFKPVSGSTDYVTGAVWVSNLKVNDPGNTDLVTYSINIQNVGPFAITLA